LFDAHLTSGVVCQTISDVRRSYPYLLSRQYSAAKTHVERSIALSLAVVAHSSKYRSLSCRLIAKAALKKLRPGDGVVTI
jgi:hypothetical protein